MKKRLISSLLTCAMLLGMTTGALTAKAEGAEPTDLVFWTYVEQHTEFMYDAVETWNANHPDEPINLSCETYPVDDMHSKLLITLQSGDGAPDLVDVNVARFSDFMQGDTKVFVELNDVIEPERMHSWSRCWISTNMTATITESNIMSALRSCSTTRRFWTQPA